MSEPLPLDGSHADTFGVVLSTALTVSVLRNRPFAFTSIRAGDPRPGLRPEHTAQIRAVALVCDAKVGGAFDGSSDLRFEPGSPAAGTYHFELPQGAAVGPVVECVAPILARSGAACTLELVGATHLAGAMTPEFLTRHWLPLVSRGGVQASLTLTRASFTPVGGGGLKLETWGWSTPTGPLDLEERGSLLAIRSVASVARLGRELGERQGRAFTDWLWEARRLEALCEVVELPSTSPGVSFYAEAVFENGRAAFTLAGEKGTAPEALGERMARRLLQFVEEETGALDPRAAERVLVPLALAGAGVRLSTSEVSPAMLAVVATMGQFDLDARAWGRPGAAGGCSVAPW